MLPDQFGEQMKQFSQIIVQFYLRSSIYYKINACHFYSNIYHSTDIAFSRPIQFIRSAISLSCLTALNFDGGTPNLFPSARATADLWIPGSTLTNRPDKSARVKGARIELTRINFSCELYVSYLFYKLNSWLADWLIAESAARKPHFCSTAGSLLHFIVWWAPKDTANVYYMHQDRAPQSPPPSAAAACNQHLVRN